MFTLVFEEIFMEGRPETSTFLSTKYNRDYRPWKVRRNYSWFDECTTSYCFLLKDGDFLAKTSHSCVIDERSLSKCPAIWLMPFLLLWPAWLVTSIVVYYSNWWYDLEQSFSRIDACRRCSSSIRVKNKLDRRSSSAYKNGEIISGVRELGFIYLDFSCVEFSYEDFSKCS